MTFELLNKPLKVFNVILIIGIIATVILIILYPMSPSFKYVLCWFFVTMLLIDGIYIFKKKRSWGIISIIGAIIITAITVYFQFILFK